ncbi:MAG: hypothetical protein QXU99_04720 [Candidatus Bathyarchaeia archaeon]
MNVIVGGGKYGCYAIEYLQQKKESYVVVDTDLNCLAVKRFNLEPYIQASVEGGYFIHGDLEKVLELIENLKPEYVFPTAPVHIAADLAKIKFNLTPWNEAINSILPKLPEVVILYAGRGKLILSFNRDHDCIDKCAMPKICPTSRIEKPCTMTELVRFACPEAFILVSYSMAPGMGALKGSELLSFFEWARTKEKFVVATTCDCHGVLDSYQKQQ